MDKPPAPLLAIIREGNGTAQYFMITHSHDIASEVCEALLAAFPGITIRAEPNGALEITSGNYDRWSDLHTVDLYRAALSWEELRVEIHRGPYFRELHMRTSRPLHPQEVVVLAQELHLAAALLTLDYGGSPLYQLVPHLGCADVSALQIQQTLAAKDANKY